ncbi:MAG: cell division protein FtsZ [Flavobacteriales bacterium]|nr:cell division protein FtsZ [Flavobacteriales bacterium]
MSEIEELGMDFQMPKNQSSQIKVMGIGGGGSNAVNYMFLNGITGVDFVVCNTDAQALEASPVPIKIQLGADLTEGLGAGSNPEIGKKAAEESADKITELLDSNTKMLFLTAGMGGGTGTGAAPVIAEIAQDKNILTVAVVTNPFSTEGGFRKQYAEEGVIELKKYVDTLLIINNDKLIEVYGDLTFTQAFGKANEILNVATKGIAEVISQHLLVNIDLNDARKVLENSGTAVMGQAEAEGENRAIEAVVGALDSPLLNDNDITGAKQVLLKIVTGEGEGEIRMSELSKIKNKIQEAAGCDVNIIEGIGIDANLGNFVSVTVIATGFEQRKKPKEPTTINLEEDKEFITNTNNETFSTLDQQQILDLSDNNIENDIMSTSQDKDSTNLLDEKTEKIYNEDNTNSDTGKKIILELETDVLKSDSKSEDLNEDSNNTNLTTQSADTKQQINKFDITDIKKGVDTDAMKVEARERENRLREISQQLRTPSGLTQLEDVPAYKRSNIELEGTSPHSSDNEISSYTLTEGENKETIIKTNNSFLHDNVD